MTTLSTKKLTITINRKQLFKNFNITFSSAQIWGILGPNGVGKTTLLHTLAGLYKSFTGQIVLQDKCLNTYPAKARAKKIGLLLQDFEFPFPNSVLETALIGRHPHQTHLFNHSTQDIVQAKRALAQVNLETELLRSVTTLSGGERRRLMIATLLTQDPDVFLLDEPTNHLDFQQQIRLLSHLKHLAKQKNKIIIMVLHDIYLMKHFCDHMILLGNNNKINVGSTIEILNQQTVNQLLTKNIFEAEWIYA